jgi:hypothetical protein
VTKKHFEMIAEALRWDWHDERRLSPACIEMWTRTVDRLAKVFEADNPRFDAEKFWKACREVRLES